MKTHTLIIHHLEETWREGLAGFDITPEDAALNIIDFLHSPQGRRINNVVLTTWEMPGPCDVQRPITEYLSARGIPYQHHIFGYGEHREMYKGQDCTLIQATRYGDDPDQVVCMEDWHEDLARHTSVSLCGAFDGECIQDAEDMLTHVRGKDGYKKLSPLTIGTYESYERRLAYESAYESARSLIGAYDERIENTEDPQEADKAVRDFSRALKLMAKQPAFQILVKYLGDQVGYLYSENDELEKAIQEVVNGIDFNRKLRSLDDQLAPSM